MAVRHHFNGIASEAQHATYADRLTIGVPEWFTDALCARVDNDIFFPKRGGSVKAAKAICARCDVLEVCRAWAIGQPEELYGIFGGLTMIERRRIRCGPRMSCRQCGQPRTNAQSPYCEACRERRRAA